MASSSNNARSNARVQERRTNWSLQQHDSATTLDLPGNMDIGKTDSIGADVKMLNQQTLREFGMAAKRAGSVTSGFASRETSPERGSIASYRAGSRPGTVQTYSAAEVKKHYAGKPCASRAQKLLGSVAEQLKCAAGPRSFASSSARRPGLETGDVVALMSEVSISTASMQVTSDG